MLIRSATSLRNGYDEMVKLAKEKQEPIYLTRNGDGPAGSLGKARERTGSAVHAAPTGAVPACRCQNLYDGRNGTFDTGSLGSGLSGCTRREWFMRQ